MSGIINPAEEAARRLRQGPSGAEVLAEALAPRLDAMLRLLGGISNQLDLLVQLECGALKRSKLREDLLEFKAQREKEDKGEVEHWHGPEHDGYAHAHLWDGEHEHGDDEEQQVAP